MTATIDSSPDNNKTVTEHPAKLSPKDSAMALIERYGVWILAGFAFCLFFYKLGSYWLFDVDEPRYAEAAREMIERGNYITPYFNYVIRLEKPVFYYWLLIGSYKLFGISEFSARLVNAVMATGLCAMTYAVARHIVCKRYAFFAAVILMTSLEFIALARMSITDMTLATLMGGTIISLFLASAKNAKWWLVAGVFSGLSILTKGPVGIILPGGVLLIYSLLTGRLKQSFFTPYFPMAIVLALALAFPWYFMAWQENGQFFIDSLLQNNVSRFSGQINYHSQPGYYYFVVLLAGFFPWTAFLPAAFANTIEQWKANIPLNFQQSQQKTLPEQQQLFWYSLVWACTVFTFFTIADTKLLTYILPMFPALALWVAALFEKNASAKTSQTGLSRISSVTGWVLFGLVVLATAVVTNLDSILPKQALHLSSDPAILLLCAILGVGTLGFSLFLKKQKQASALLTLGLAFSLLAITALNSVVPKVNALMQETLVSYVKRVGTSPLATYEITKPSLTYYARRKILQIGHEADNPASERDKLKAFLDTGCRLDNRAHARQSLRDNNCQPAYIITKNGFLHWLTDNLPPDAKYRVVDRSPVYSLIEFK